ncbi:hypothetical protein DK846_05945, partial [Methanospirillum lacunae]
AFWSIQTSLRTHLFFVSGKVGMKQFRKFKPTKIQGYNCYIFHFHLKLCHLHMIQICVLNQYWPQNF